MIVRWRASWSPEGWLTRYQADTLSPRGPSSTRVPRWVSAIRERSGSPLVLLAIALGGTAVVLLAVVLVLLLGSRSGEPRAPVTPPRVADASSPVATAPVAAKTGPRSPDPGARKAAAPVPNFTNSIGMKLVYIKPGTFMMGSPPGEEGHKNDETQHRVTITKGFYLGAYEVTQGQYEKVMGKRPSGSCKGDDRPAEYVRSFDAKEFCQKLSQREGRTYRLPTEAEWEYACRAGTTTPFAFGDTISTDQANYDGRLVYGNGRKGEYRGAALPVGTLEPNAWGLYDMHGNVREWCDGEHLSMLRGGNWVNHPIHSRSACRCSWSYHQGGFRVLCVAPVRLLRP